MSVSGGLNVHPQTAAYRALINCIRMLNLNYRPVPAYRQAGNAAQNGEAQFFLSDTLAQTFNKRCSVPIAIGIWCGTHLISQPTVFIAAGAAVGLFAVVYCFLKALMVSSYRLGIVLFCYRKRTRPPRL